MRSRLFITGRNGIRLSRPAGALLEESDVR
jgi:hypothetical protein